MHSPCSLLLTCNWMCVTSQFVSPVKTAAALEIGRLHLRPWVWRVQGRCLAAVPVIDRGTQRSGAGQHTATLHTAQLRPDFVSTSARSCGCTWPCKLCRLCDTSALTSAMQYPTNHTPITAGKSGSSLHSNMEDGQCHHGGQGTASKREALSCSSRVPSDLRHPPISRAHSKHLHSPQLPSCCEQALSFAAESNAVCAGVPKQHACSHRPPLTAHLVRPGWRRGPAAKRLSHTPVLYCPRPPPLAPPHPPEEPTC